MHQPQELCPVNQLLTPQLLLLWAGGLQGPGAQALLEPLDPCSSHDRPRGDLGPLLHGTLPLGSGQQHFS